jgi:hypothetical protein
MDRMSSSTGDVAGRWDLKQFRHRHTRSRTIIVRYFPTRRNQSSRSGSIETGALARSSTRLILRNTVQGMLRIPAEAARRSEMSIVRRLLGTVAVAAVLAMALMAPTGAEARNGRIAAGAVVDAAASWGDWGPSPPYYPYYHYGYYGVPVGGPGPVWGPYEYRCYRQAVSTGRHWRRVRVCD